MSTLAGVFWYVVKYKPMQIGKTYTRTKPDGHTTTITIDTQAQLDYHRDLADCGYKYTEKLTIHSSDNNCIACES